MPLERKYWLLSCVFGSFLCWFFIRLFSAKELASGMGHQYLSNRRVSVIATEEQARKASRIGKLMESVSRNVPWECKCLSEAICVKWLLNRYQIPAVFYLGARLNDNEETADGEPLLQAHAWIKVGPYTVIGAPTHRHYQVVATFVTPILESTAVMEAHA